VHQSPSLLLRSAFVMENLHHAANAPKKGKRTGRASVQRLMIKRSPRNSTGFAGVSLPARSSRKCREAPGHCFIRSSRSMVKSNYRAHPVAGFCSILICLGRRFAPNKQAQRARISFHWRGVKRNSRWLADDHRRIPTRHLTAKNLWVGGASHCHSAPERLNAAGTAQANQHPQL
jgi:hypothetical protein